MKHLNPTIFLISAMLFSLILNGQSYTSYFTGNEVNIDVQPQFGLCLMGGAGESDEAMVWFLERANGGDVVVLRASGSGGYNDYMYSELGVTINSVETIVFNTAEAAFDPYVIDKVNNAEAIWMAGGDQNDYVTYWKDTPIQDAINNLINVKSGPVGGISAGMAVMGQAYFSAGAGSITSENALANPFAFQMQFGYNDFIDAPFLENVITETHLNDPDRIRYGRVFAFMARLAYDQGVRPYGIGSNEFAAVAIDQDGIARGFGEYPEYEEDLVYFLQGNCVEPNGPEIILAAQPLTWNRSGEAVKVYRLPATATGENYLDLNNWTAGEGGFWENWYVIEGELTRDTDASAPECVVSVRNHRLIEALVFPNPSSGTLHIQTEEAKWTYQIFDVAGRLMGQGTGGSGQNELNLKALPQGIYKLSIRTENANFSSSFVIVQ